MKPITPTTPHVIIMVGIPGAGKSAFAEHFAKTFQAPTVNTQQIQNIASVDSATATALSHLLLDELLKTNRTIIYEGPTATKTSRLDISRRVSAAGYKPLLVWVQTESLEAKRRATKKQKDGSQLSAEDFDAAIKRFHPPAATEKVVVISGKHTYTTQLKIVLKHLAGQHRAIEPTVEQPRVRSTRNIIIR